MKNTVTLGIIALACSLNAHAETYLQPSDVVALYFQSLQTGDIGTLANLLDDNIVWHQPGKNVLSGTHAGKQAVLELFGRFMQISEGSFKIDAVTSIMANGNMVSASLSFSAQRCQYLTVDMRMKGIDVMRVENGLIKEVFLFSENQDQEDAFWGRP